MRCVIGSGGRGKIGRIGKSRDIRITAGIHRDISSVIAQRPSYEGRVQKRGPIGIQFGNEYVIVTVLCCVIGPARGRIIARIGTSRDIRIAAGIDRQTIFDIGGGSAYEGRIDKTRSGGVQFGYENIRIAIIGRIVCTGGRGKTGRVCIS